MSFWTIEGIGFNTNKIEPFINKKKLAKVLLKQLPDDELLLETMKGKKYCNLDIRDFLYGEPFDGLGDLLAHCDDTNSLTYGDNGNGESYFYYPPSYPWEWTENEPSSIAEVHERIIKAVLCLCDMTSEQVEKLIDDDFFDYGYG